MTVTQIVLNFGEGDSCPFFFRDQSTGDRGVIQQIFVKRDYDLTRFARCADINSEYRRILDGGKTPLIIDCGANIGASPVWFARAFPEAHIVAIEPEEHNYQILRLNSRKYPNITCENAATSCVNETVYVEDPGKGDWGFRTSANPDATKASVPAYSIENIEKRFSGSELFMVKIDIEGGEARLFEENLSWIDRAIIIIIELHDWLMPGTANSRNCLKALSDRNRDFLFVGENVFSVRNC